MSERPEPPPEARLIAAALKRARMSVRKAASRADMSEGRWRQIMNGYQTVSAGVHIPVTGPPETVARMARVAGVRPDQLADAGREDAAEELRALIAPPEPEPGPKEPQTYAELAEVLDNDPELARAVLDLIRRAARKGQPGEQDDQERHRDAG